MIKKEKERLISDFNRFYKFRDCNYNMAFRGLRFCKECFNILLPKERINGDEREL